jgi:hypothetical protein
MERDIYRGTKVERERCRERDGERRRDRETEREGGGWRGRDVEREIEDKTRKT